MISLTLCEVTWAKRLYFSINGKEACEEEEAIVVNCVNNHVCVNKCVCVNNLGSFLGHVSRREDLPLPSVDHFKVSLSGLTRKKQLDDP